ncbi:MAG: hypothetical protein U0Y68_05400 [Blastocatellia bacterium]
MERKDAEGQVGETANEQRQLTARSLRLWPGIVLASVLVVVTYVLPRLAPDADLFGFRCL